MQSCGYSHVTWCRKAQQLEQTVVQEEKDKALRVLLVRSRSRVNNLNPKPCVGRVIELFLLEKTCKSIEPSDLPVTEIRWVSTCCLYQTCRELASKHFQSGKTKIPSLGTKFRSGSPRSRPCAAPGLGRAERRRRAGGSTRAALPDPREMLPNTAPLPGAAAAGGSGPAAGAAAPLPSRNARQVAPSGGARQEAAGAGGAGRPGVPQPGWGCASAPGTQPSAPAAAAKAAACGVPPPERFHTRMVPSLPPSVSQSIPVPTPRNKLEEHQQLNVI